MIQFFKSFKFRYFRLLILLPLLFSCSVKKDTFISRNYHKLNSHYNGYFNGNESLKEGVVLLDKAHKDNYLKMLPVFRYGNEQDAQSVATNMDRAITKASTVIKRHSMFIKKRERNSWIPQSYMLIGKANFYKQNYMGAKVAFEYVLSNYKKTPVTYEASTWLARTYNQMHKFEKSQPQLASVQNKIEKTGGNITFKDKLLNPFVKKEIPLKVYKDLPLIYSDFYLQQENYGPAIEHLKKGIEMNHKKKLRARLTFILAQIYQSNGELNHASRFYRKVLKLNPKYEMAFNAKMNLAKCYDSKNANSKGIKKELLKMVKDIRNKEYLDQIYYALAEIELRENNLAEAIKYLKLSAASGTNNPNQKAITYLKIADIYFNKPDYIYAASYYDSTMTILPKDYPDYVKLMDKKNTLNGLAKNLKTVKLEDSLQVLANMSEKDRDMAIQKLINDYIKKEEDKRQAELNKQINMANFIPSYTGQNQQGGTGSNWYFYNQNTIKFGINDFTKKWGSRPLEDNWRLSNKKQVAFANFDDPKSDSDSSDTDNSKSSPTTFNPKDKKSYLKNIPLTPEDMKKSKERVEEALYSIGFIYKEGLFEFKKSTEAFEELVKRFPESKYLLSSYYQLYSIYNDDLHNTSKADFYKDLLLTKFPDSDYAKMIKDPEYAKHISSARDEVASLYKDTYQAYIDSKFNIVIENSNKALKAYHGNDLLPKFGLIKALSIGKTSDINAFKASLNEVVTQYPNTKPKIEAQNILNYLANNDKKAENKSLDKSTNTPTSKSLIFSENPEAIHLYIMLIDAKDANINDIKIAISDFDTQQFSLAKLSISSNYLSGDKQLITVTNFDNRDNAMRYYNTIKDNKAVQTALKQTKYQQYVITTDNYTILMKNKDFPGYSKFFEEVYMK